MKTFFTFLTALNYHWATTFNIQQNKRVYYYAGWYERAPKIVEGFEAGILPKQAKQARPNKCVTNNSEFGVCLRGAGHVAGDTSVRADVFLAHVLYHVVYGCGLSEIVVLFRRNTKILIQVKGQLEVELQMMMRCIAFAE